MTECTYIQTSSIHFNLKEKEGNSIKFTLRLQLYIINPSAFEKSLEVKQNVSVFHIQKDKHTHTTPLDKVTKLPLGHGQFCDCRPWKRLKLVTGGQ